MNPRRRHRRRSSPKRRRGHRRHYRRNPGFAGGIMGDVKAIMPVVGWGLVGYAGTSVLPGQLSRFGVPVPSKEESPIGYYGVKVLTAIGLGWLAGAVMGRHVGRLVLAGAGLTVGAELVNQFALAPMGLSTYLPDDMGTYLPGSEVSYLSPGQTVGEDEYGGGEAPVIRLDPARRF